MSSSRVRRPSACARVRAAGTCRMEDRLGTIEPGKLADLAVLDRDYFTVPDVEIKKIRSLLTVVDGKVVHEAAGVRTG